MYKLGGTHVFVDSLSRLPDITEPTRVFDQTIDVSLFYVELEWLNDVKEFLRKDILRAHYWYNTNKD